MPILTPLTISLRRKLVLAVIGILLTIAFGTVALYAGFHETKPSISVVTTNQTNVLDVRKPLEDLSISFRGKNVQEENLNLLIFSVRVENDGQADILQSHYDRDDVWGIQVQNGEVIEARLIDSNSEYIKSNLNPQLSPEGNTIEFRKIIFDRRNFFTLEILVLHEKTQLPEIVPVGKIAGIDKVVATKFQAGEDEQGFVDQLFRGTVGVHAVRAILYFVTFIVGGVSIALVAIAITASYDTIRKAPRKRELKRFWRHEPKIEVTKKKTLSNIYVERGLEGLRRTSELLEDAEKLGQRVREYDRLKRRLESRGVAHRDRVIREDASASTILRRVSLWPVGDLLESGVVSRGKPNQVQIDTEFKKWLDRLLAYLEKEEEI